MRKSNNAKNLNREKKRKEKGKAILKLNLKEFKFAGCVVNASGC